MKRIINIVARIVVGCLFILSGFFKLVDPVGSSIKFKEYFFEFGIDFLNPVALGFALLLSTLEFAIGIALLLNYRMRITTSILLPMIAFFTFLTFATWWFGIVRNCGCFGDAITLSPLESFSKNVILLILSVVLFKQRNSLKPVLTSRPGDVVTGMMLVLAFSFGYYNIAHLPAIDFRPYAVGNKIPEMMEAEEEPEYAYIYKKDGNQFRFDHVLTDTTYEYVESVIKNKAASTPEIINFSIGGPEGKDLTKEVLSGKKLLIIIKDADKVDKAAVKRIETLVRDLKTSEVEPFILSSSGGEALKELLGADTMGVSYGLADGTLLKTMIRSNPGLILMHDGTIKGKWHHNDTPDASTLKSRL